MYIIVCIYIYIYHNIANGHHWFRLLFEFGMVPLFSGPVFFVGDGNTSYQTYQVFYRLSLLLGDVLVTRSIKYHPRSSQVISYISWAHVYRCGAMMIHRFGGSSDQILEDSPFHSPRIQDSLLLDLHHYQ